MLHDVLLLAQKCDKEFSICLKAAHAQLALVGMYAKTCQRHAAAASKKKGGSRGCHVNGTGWARIVSDPQLVAEIDWMDVARGEAECKKESCQQACTLREAELAHLSELRDAR